jgi:anti-anti-sigma factor
MFMDTRSTFRVEILDWGSMWIIALHGELDVSAQEALMGEIDAVLAERPVVLAVDLRGLTFMDSTGVHALISTGLHCQEHGQRFFVIRGGGHIDRVLSACGVDGSFEMVSGPDQLPDGEFTLTSGL